MQVKNQYYANACSKHIKLHHSRESGIVKRLTVIATTLEIYQPTKRLKINAAEKKTTSKCLTDDYL